MRQVLQVVARRIQARAEEWQRAAGLLPPEPQLLTYHTAKPEPVSEPALMSTVQGDPEAFMTLNLSRNLNSGANPAYQLRDGFQTHSCMKADFIWDQEEVSRAGFWVVALMCLQDERNAVCCCHSCSAAC